MQKIMCYMKYSERTDLWRQKAEQSLPGAGHGSRDVGKRECFGGMGRFENWKVVMVV